jgi:hypothetical protein
VRHRRAALAAALLLAGCPKTPALLDRAASTPGPSGVVLLLRGSAFKQAAARDEAVAVAHEVTGRPVRLLADEPPMERALDSAVRRFDKHVARAARADAGDVACRKKGRAVATVVAEHADVLLRVQLDAATVSHRASADERKELAPQGGLPGMLSSVGLDRGDTVYVTKLDGTVERTTFPGSTTTAKQRVRWAGRRLGKSKETPPPTVRDAIAQALAKMPPPSAARWEVVARGLVAGGCPVLGAAVADTFLADGAAKRRIRAAATGALGSAGKPDEQAPPAATDAPPTEMASGGPEPAPDPAPTTTEPAYTCTTLCTLQMIELCNNDRTLWSQHGSHWETTRCGLRRNEAFLEDCYRMQWLSGTYEASCIRPCEQSAEGRTRLVAMLRRSGCLRSSG